MTWWPHDGNRKPLSHPEPNDTAMLRPTLALTMAFMPYVLLKDRIRGMTRSYGFTLTGDEGGQWTLHVTDGAPRVEPGPFSTVDVEFITDPATHLLVMVWGRGSRAKAALTGKARMKGDPVAGMRVGSLFPPT